MQKHPTHKNSSGFTLIEMLIAIAIIGILAVVAIPKYNQYKIRGYDAHSKQALKDMHLLCNAYWLDSDPLQECELPIIKKATYGFNQNPEVVLNLPSPTADNLCATAKHNSSPNTYRIDSVAIISEGEKCAGSVNNESVAEESVQIASVPEPAPLAAVEPIKAEQAAAEKAAQAEAARISANAPLIVQRRRGGCPLGWSEKGSWCVAEPNAPAILSDGEGNPCPSGWTKEKRFCVEGPNAPSAVLLNPTFGGGCPSGWTNHAKFCVAEESNAPSIVQRRRGGCPLGWSEEGSWCVAEPNAPAILSDGEGNPCPSGWTKEKRFCVAGPNAPSAVLMNPTVINSCPPGWTKHAKFCIKDD